MGEDDAQNAFFHAPTELRADGRVPNEGVAALTNERPGECGAVANVNLHVLQRRSAIMNEQEIRSVKNACPARTDSVCNGRSQDRVFNGESLEGDAANLGRLAFIDLMSIFDVAIS